MTSDRISRAERSAATTIRVPTRISRTFERQLEDIMAQVSPRRLGDSPLRGVASILFVTISDFDTLCEEVEPPEIGSILETYLDTVADSVGKFLGTVQNTMGDTVMAAWNAANPQPDHAVLAVNSAIDIIDRNDDINQQLRIAGLREISYAVGINTGDMLLLRTGPGRGESEVVGDSVNMARLLSLVAPACGILIAEGTRVLVGDQILVEPTDITILPGKRKPVRVFRVLGTPESG